MSFHKRKAASQVSERPSKKPQITTTVKVNHIHGRDTARPVVASPAGTILSASLSFSSYSKANASGSNELLLQSSDHPTIDFTALESSSTISNQKYLKHYVAVFDPTTGRLDVTEAKKMIVRSQVRQFERERESDEEDETEPVPPTPARAALTEAFGSKKSKRAFQSRSENRLLARGGDGDDALSQAILTSMAGEAEDGVGGPTSSQTNKPLPPANLETHKVEEIYSLSSLVVPQPGDETLSELSFAYWKARIAANKAIKSHFHFVSNRVEFLIRRHLKLPENTSIARYLQVLRYIELLLELHRYIIALPERKPIPNQSRWPEKTLSIFFNVTEELLPQLMAHFFPDNMRTRYAVMLLRTTILALTLHIPPPSLQVSDKVLITEPTDIARDLGLERSEASKFFRELGCKVEPATDAELDRWGLTKMKQKTQDENGKQIILPKPRFAKLRLPLDFPKLSLGKRVSSGNRR